MLRRRPARRSGSAAAETAVVLSLVLVPLLIGVWEMGRLIHAQQVVANAAREGARLAAQGRTVTPDGPKLITVRSDDPARPNVADTVYQALVTGGLSGLKRSDVTIEFTFRNPDGTPASSPAEPHEAAKNQRFRVTVTVPFDKVRWVNLGLVNPRTVTYSVDWFMLVDDPFAVNTTLPTW